MKELNNDDENIHAITEIENALNEKRYFVNKVGKKWEAFILNVFGWSEQQKKKNLNKGIYNKS